MYFFSPSRIEFPESSVNTSKDFSFTDIADYSARGLEQSTRASSVGAMSLHPLQHRLLPLLLVFVKGGWKYHRIIAFISLTALRIFSYLDFLFYKLPVHILYPFSYWIVSYQSVALYIKDMDPFSCIITIFFLDSHFIIYLFTVAGDLSFNGHIFYFIINSPETCQKGTTNMFWARAGYLTG